MRNSSAEYRKFKKETEKRLWLLEHKPRFNYNDPVKYEYHSSHCDACYEGIFKGIASIEYDEFINSWRRMCYVEIGNSISIWNENELNLINIKP